MVAYRLYIWSIKLLLDCLPVTMCLIGTICSGGFFESALANSDGPVLLDMPIYNQTSSDDLVGRAEAMVSQEINRHFDTNPSTTPKHYQIYRKDPVHWVT